MSIGTPLERLFAVERAAFLASHWPATPLCAPGELARVGDLADIESIEAFVRAHRGVIQVHEPVATGGVEHRAVDPAGALAAYRAGFAMDARDVQRWFPPARAWLEALAMELGVDAEPGSTYCHAFVSPPGTGVGKHFDNREVFVLQIIGRKHWQLAPNHAWPLPLMPHAAGAVPHPYNRRAPAEALADRTMPADAVEHVLAPGAALFVPRGYWHATRALEPSLSFSLGVRCRTRVERFVERLRAELALDPAWRAPARELPADAPASATFSRGLYAALAALREGSGS